MRMVQMNGMPLEQNPGQSAVHSLHAYEQKLHMWHAFLCKKVKSS